MSDTTPKDQRGPTNLRIKFRSASVDQFIERYAVDVSRGGIFIRTREPLAVGTQLRLELQLQDATPLLSGEGTVIWIRENDPARPTVPPGMAVRFDKVSPDTQPTLDRILGEKARLEEAGQIPVPQAGGMAVRRPSAVLSSLDNSGRVSAAVSNAPTTPVAAPGAGAPEAGGTGAAPVTKTAFLSSRSSGTGERSAPGPFTRARQTGTRPVPVPSALFEPPTAADIDKALSVLEEAPGPAPMPATPSVPRFVDHEMSNEPTRVGDSSVLAAAAGGDDLVELPSDAIEREPSGSETLEGKPPGVPTAVEAAATTAERPVPSVPAAATVPEVSRRFRAASRPYPTLKKGRGTGVVIALIVVVGAAAAAVWKLRPGSRVPLTAPSSSALTIAPAAGPATPAPAAQAPQPAPAPAPAAPAPAPAADKPAETKPAEAKAAPEKPAETKAADKSSHEERGSSRHAAHHRGHEEASSARSAGKETGASKEAAAAEAKPAETTTAPALADNAPAADKPAAADQEAAAPAADKPATAKAAVLKITSTPAGADVTIDGSNMGITPFTSKEVDPTAPHVIRLVKDGFESNERMIGTSDWSRPRGNAPPTLKMNVKLRRVGGAPAADTPKENAAPADDTGGPYIKEVTPTSP